MRQSGNGANVAPSSLSRYAILPHRRLPHVVTALGDSRIAAIYTNAGQGSYSAHSPLNWANALSDQRLVVGATFGVSGDRTDQMIARLNSAIATGAGMLYLQGGLNDIAQNYPTAGSSGATAFANIRAMADAARQAGMIVVIEMEVGSNVISTSALCGQVNELNARLYEYAERTPGILLHDARPVVLQTDFSATAMSYRTGYTYDGTHVNGRGAYYWAKSLALLLQSVVPPRAAVRMVGRAEAVGNGRRNYLANPCFVPATGGGANDGTSGTVPSGWSASKSAGATGAFGNEVDAAGLGNHVVVAATFAAQGDYVRLYQDVNPASWDVGEVVEGTAKITVSSPVNMAIAHLNVQANVGGSSYDNFALYGLDTVLGPDEGYTATVKTRPFVIPAGTKGWLTMCLWMRGGGAGSANVVVHHAAMRRRETPY